MEEPPAEQEEIPTEPPTESPTESPTGEVLFRDDFNSIPTAHKAAGGWYAQCNSGRMTAVNGVARFEVRAGDTETDTGSPRCELSGGGPGLNQGDDVWVYDRFRWGADDTANPQWELVNQWHDGGPSGSQYSPSLALFRYGTSIRLINGKGSPIYWNGAAIERGVWETLVYHYVPSTSGNGKVEAWWNGTKVADYTGKTLNTEDAYLKIGINRSKSTTTGTSVVEHDRLVIATTRAAAER